MAVGLFTSRVILQALGISDYGIYNVVGGFVSMLAYLNSVFVAATQRFLSFAIGKGDKENLKRVFCTSITIHYVLAIIIFIIAESFGLWFVNTHLNIAPDRIVAANWVFQCSLVTLMINIISIPYNSSIVAHEHMNVYAYMSIFDVVSKLLVVYTLWLTSWDKLIVYAVLLVFVSAIIRLVYTIYCKRHFEECNYHFILDKAKIREMASYAGWTAIGGLGFVAKDQGFNIVLNLFLGTAVNAARGVALQVNGMINQFASNFMMAVSPQITKQYAAGNIERSRKLVYISSKFSFFLMSIVVIPIAINLQYILELWLDVVPKYTYEFMLVIFSSSVISTLATPLATAINATGKIKTFQIGVSIIFMLELPIAYYLLYMEYPPYVAMMPAVLTQFLAVLFRFIILRKQVVGYSLRYFAFKVLAYSVIVVSLSAISSFYIRSLFNNGISSVVITSLISVIVTTLIIYIIGLTIAERKIINNYAIRIITKYKKM